MNIAKTLKKILAKSNSTTHKKDHTTWPSGIYPKFTRMVIHMQMNQCDTPHQQKKRQKPMDEKTLDKIQHPFMMKTLTEWV